MPAGIPPPPRDQAPPPSRHPTRAGTPQKQAPPSRACWEIQSTSGRYASYWNAILFLHVSVILFTGGSALLHAGIHPLGTRGRHPPPQTRGRHPQSRHPPGTSHPTQDQGAPPRSRHPPDQAPPGTRKPPPPQVHCMLGDMGNKRAVCILLECNLVSVSTIIQDLLWVTTHPRTIVIKCYQCTVNSQLFKNVWLNTQSWFPKIQYPVPSLSIGSRLKALKVNLTAEGKACSYSKDEERTRYPAFYMFLYGRKTLWLFV